MIETLKYHASKYKEMMPQDAVKLIYQNEFGGGHLIQDEEACLRYLRREYEATPKNPAVPQQESIGNGICRVNLAALEAGELVQLSSYSRAVCRLMKEDFDYEGAMADLEETIAYSQPDLDYAITEQAQGLMDTILAQSTER